MIGLFSESIDDATYSELNPWLEWLVILHFVFLVYIGFPSYNINILEFLYNVLNYEANI